MHIHILGICGTFMAGIAVLAKQLGYVVTGCDHKIYPPMSDMLAACDIAVWDGFSETQVEISPNLFVIGNVISRGENPLMERILDLRLPYISGPQWLNEIILRHKHVLAVAGTHGKTTTSALLSWILSQCGYDPGFLIGGVPVQGGISAQLSTSDSDFFVIEADEYDTAFFDKRAKFVHYGPKTLVLNNLEFDHADIYRDLNQIKQQFGYLLRLVPRSGQVIVNGEDANLRGVILGGCWSEVILFGQNQRYEICQVSGGDFVIRSQSLQGNMEEVAVSSCLRGQHNRMNIVAAMLAAQQVGINLAQSAVAVATFQGVKRRLQCLGTYQGICVFDDFAHHPTAILATIEALREEPSGGRIIVVLELRSNTMKRGDLKEALCSSLSQADLAFVLDSGTSWAAGTLSPVCTVLTDISDLLASVYTTLQSGDQVLVMSNGSFGDFSQNLVKYLKSK